MKRMFSYVIKFATVCLAIDASAQTAPLIVHSQLYGGSHDDHPGPFMETPDKGYVIGGWTTSNDGQVVGYHGGSSDIWAVRIDSGGNFLWGKTIGGSAEDDVYSIAITANAYIIAGASYSTDGDFDTIPEPPLGTAHCKGFIAWLNPANGNIRRMKGYMGNMVGEIKSIKALDNGNLIVLGLLESSTLTKKMWIALLDSSGGIIWDKYYGTADNATGENPTSIIQKRGGGYIATAQTNSITGDVHGFHGGADVWLLNIDDTGKILWAKCYDGSAGEGPYGIYETSDNGFICTAITNSNDGDVTGFHGVEDYWVFKTDDTGRVIWSKTIGGSNIEVPAGTDGTCDDGVVVSGYSSSTDGDITGHIGASDLFIVRLDSSGHIVWTHNYGSSTGDFECYITTTTDNGYAFTGFTGTADHDVSGTPHGLGDIWFAKLALDGLLNYCPPVTTSVSFSEANQILSVYPNPATGELTVENAVVGSTIRLFNILGQQVYNGIIVDCKHVINTKNLIASTYLLQLTDNNGNKTTKTIVKQ